MERTWNHHTESATSCEAIALRNILEIYYYHYMKSDCNFSYLLCLIFIDFEEIKCQRLLLSKARFCLINKFGKVWMTFREKKGAWENQTNRIMLQTKFNKRLFLQQNLTISPLYYHQRWHNGNDVILMQSPDTCWQLFTLNNTWKQVDTSANWVKVETAMF